MKALLSIPALCLLASCQSHRRAPESGPDSIAARLRQIDPDRETLVAQTPVLDCHIHTFNARYLPLRGILLGKRDAAAPWSWLLSDRCAVNIADWIVERTPPLAGEPIPFSSTPTPAPQPRSVGPFCTVVVGLLDKAAANRCWDTTLPLKERAARVEATARGMTLTEKTAVRTAARMMGFAETVQGREPQQGLDAFLRFVWILTLPDSDLPDFYRIDHGFAPGDQSLAFVTHSMDLAPVYDQRPDPLGMVDFATVQIIRTAAQTSTRDHWFVAYNPYRDHWPAAQPGDALRLVQNAVKNHGARGVKVYPPSGYRPHGNAVKPRPVSLVSPAPGRQWDARYPAGEEDAINADLDRKLNELLLWCLKEDVPVFAHCGHGEFEARKGYGAHHSDPAFWHSFLRENPGPNGEPCRLRLCLGHAGGADFWFGTGRQARWGQEVHQMCVTFPNVYCEVTADAELVDPRHQAHFANRLIQLIGQPPDFATFPFEKKILFGSDWPLPDRAPASSVLRAARQVFLLDPLRDHYEAYFYTNCLDYLNLEP